MAVFVLLLLGCSPATDHIRFPATGEDVQAIMRANADDLGWCHLESPEAHGHVVIVWDVLDGRVPYARLEGNTTRHPELGRCVRDAIRTWRPDLPDGTWTQQIVFGPRP
jgi:hypothetical protein